MFEVAVEQTFAAAHFLRNYKGKCENLHGHNYRVQLVMQGQTLDEAGMLMDFTDMKRELKRVSEYLDHRHLNELPPFDVVNPSAENIAKFFCDELRKSLPDSRARIKEVNVWETDRQYATYRP